MPRSTAASAEEEDEGIQLLINPSHQLIPFRSKSPRPCISLHRAALQENDQRCANRNHQSAIKSARSELDDVKTGREKIWCNPDQSFQSRNSYAQRSCAVPRPFFFACVCWEKLWLVYWIVMRRCIQSSSREILVRFTGSREFRLALNQTKICLERNVRDDQRQVEFMKDTVLTVEIKKKDFH